VAQTAGFLLVVVAGGGVEGLTTRRVFVVVVL
jgi:hypothetical protein